jgi:hypothetical protein
MLRKKNAFADWEMRLFEPAEKIGLVACVNPEGLPHISLITSMMAPKPDQVTLGQFCEGLSKQYIQQDPKIAFLIMTMDERLWRGRAVWTHLRKDGPEYERYNELPMFRYNAYFGIHTVHYLDLIETSAAESLSMGRIVLASILTKLVKPLAKTGLDERVLKPFAEDLFNHLAALKFMAWIGAEGFPTIIPVIQCQAADSRRLAFSAAAYGSELRSVPEGTCVAVFCLTTSMEDVLVRGRFDGFRRGILARTGTVDIDWVYNSMPPCHGQVYPEVELRPVTEF